MDLERTLKLVAREVRKGVILYLETHREVLSERKYENAYKIARNAFVNDYFKDIPVYYIGALYKAKVSNLLEETSAEEIEACKKDVSYFVELVEKYDIEYNGLLEEYFD